MFDPEYFGALLFLTLGVGMGAVVVLLVRFVTRYLGLAKKSRGKYETYECGVPLLGSSRERFSVKFYLVALLFVLFDIETVFLLPYAVSYRQLGLDAFLAVLAFVAVLGLGLLYILKRRVLEWD
ncbi:MAG TPA: NADH-quinone oxidoreductase subunit A [Planctomycetota bacterium]|nr:NADH-quinone oxidoreductase subunit A [Planctomycetota bacterium]